jgi:hypothetical protein
MNKKNIKSKLISILITVILSTTILLAIPSVSAKSAANLDQLRNGRSTAPWNPPQWVNGNAGSLNAHYVEGYSIAYRCIMTDLPTGSPITITFGYDIKHSDRHAIDYLTNYSRINYPTHVDVFGHAVEIINPLDGITGVGSTRSYFVIPVPSTVGSPVPGQPAISYNDVITNEGIDQVEMSCFGGTISNINYFINGDLTSSNSETQINVTFTADSNTVVLAWGGHIASRNDWGYDGSGVPRSAGGISGSPYHMRLIGWTLNNLGNQDRSLSCDAIYVPPFPSIFVNKTAYIAPGSLPGVDGPLNANICDKIVYCYNITNTGTVTLYNIGAIDDILGIVVDHFDGISLLPGESYIASVEHVIDESNIPSINNIVIANGTDPKGNNITDDDNFTVNIGINPAINVNKTAYIAPGSPPGEDGPLNANIGDKIVYCYNITNTGDVTLFNVGAIDDILGIVIDHIDGISLLPSESYIASVEHVIDESDIPSINNIVIANGTDPKGNNITDDDNFTVNIDAKPGINIEKSSDKSIIHPGEDITYYYWINNTGGIQLQINSLVDDILGDIINDPNSQLIGDINNDGWLDTNESWCYSITQQWNITKTMFTINLPTDPVMLNVVNGTVSYYDLTLSGVPDGYDVTNGPYICWCIQRDITMPRGVNHTVSLCSSYYPNLPDFVKSDNWPKVNYLLNNKNGYGKIAIQDAIWYFINNKSTTNPDALALINDANDNGKDFEPYVGQILAVIAIGSPQIQRTIFEVELPDYPITNNIQIDAADPFGTQLTDNDSLTLWVRSLQL